MIEKRSNISTSYESGIRTRQRVYDEFLKYADYKRRVGGYDDHDLVLRLINSIRKDGAHEIFQSLYIDEVQDFSFALVYLLARYVSLHVAIHMFGNC